MIIKSVDNKNGNNYSYDIFLEKGSYEYKSNTQYFKNKYLHIINAIF